MSHSLITILVLLLVAFSGAGGQTHPQHDALRKIPEDLRESLQRELQLVVQYQSKSDWQKLFDMLLPEWRGDSRDKYLRSKKRSNSLRLAKFTPTSVSTEIYTPEGVVDTSKQQFWIIVGCGAYGRGWFKSKYLSQIEAQWGGKRWLFSEVHITFESVDGPPAPCRKEK